MFSWFNFKSPWKELTPAKTGNVRPQLIQIEDCIWWSTNYNEGEQGMVQYDIQLDKITSVVKYPNNIKPSFHSCCKYKNEIYIVDGMNGQIIAFNTQNKQFQIKIKTEKIGAGTQCIAMYDDVHIFGGEDNSKHLVYRIKENKIKILNDTTTTANIVYASIVKYKDQIIRFGGWNWDRKQCVDALFISSRIKRNTLNDIGWTSMPSWKCNEGVSVCGYLMYKHYIIMFGGWTGTRARGARVDTICVLNVKSVDDGWIALKHIKCPMPSTCHAVVDTKENIHILSAYNDNKDCKHYSISISSVLKDMLENEDEEEKHDTQSEEVKQAKEDPNDELRKENEHLQSLVGDLVNNQNEAKEEANKTIQMLRNVNERLKREAIQLKQDKKEALVKVDSMRTEFEAKFETVKQESKAVKRVHLKAMERMTQLTRENSALSEECKEKTLELRRLRARALDTEHYLQWSDSEVVDWIISIESGKYAVYEENLRLLFASESVNGMALSQISKPDLKDWGIKNFAHRSNLYNQIQKLVNQHQQMQQYHDEDVEGTTAYI